MLVALIALAAGWLFAVTYAARTVIAGESESEAPAVPQAAAQGPSAAQAIVPILFPIVLIILKSIATLPSHPFGQATVANVIGFIGEPVVALLLGVFFAFLLPRRLSLDMLSTSGWVGEGVLAAATIILITGCGGAFGKVLQSSGIADVIAGNLGHSASLSLLLPFAIAAGLKTAQGSSTVAIITTAGILSPLLGTLGLEGATARALTVVAIGAGSMVVSHANDSYFWVVTGFTRMTVNQGYRLQTLGTFVEGCAAAVALWVISLVVL
jgi:GntP family gluconate:H+ symporter